MGLDAGTLVTVLVIVCAVLAGLLSLTWAQNRGVPALGEWTVCFFLFAMAAAILALRDRLPGLLAVDIANGLRLLGYGLAWQAARHFSARKGNAPLMLAPAILWLGASALQVFGEDLRLRVVVTAPVVAAYAFAVAGELWRAPQPIWIARLAAALVVVHGTIFAARFVSALLMTDSSLQVGGIVGPLHPFAILEGVVASVTLAFLLLSAMKEEIGLQHRQAALLDPLTGVANRRGFEAEVKRTLARGGGASTALLLLDLDEFKSVNDGWGHPAGDRILNALTRTVTEALGPGDVPGRLGGDEFAVVLADSRIDQALVVAERIRRAVAATKVRDAGVEIGCTVSIGVTSLRDAESFDALFGVADTALYRAKARGGNRVEFVIEPRSAPAPGLPRQPRKREPVKRVA